MTLSKTKLLNFISANNLNLIVAKKNYYSLIPIISLVLNEYAINQKKRVYMYCINEPRAYYISNLISLVTGIDIHTIHNYNDPCNCYNVKDKNTLKDSEHDSYLNGMKRIIESDLLIEQYTDSLEKHIIKREPLDSILHEFKEEEQDNNSDIIIIDSLSLIVEKTKYSKIDIMQKLKDYSKKYNTKFLIFDSWEHFSDNKDIDNIVTVTQEITEDTSNKLILDNNNERIEIKLNNKKEIVENEVK